MPKLRSLLILALVVVVVSGAAGTSVIHALQPDQPPTISVAGRIRYDTGSAIVAAPGLTVKLIDYDVYTFGPGETLAETVTDELGRYSFTDVSNNDIDGPENRPDEGQDVQLLIETTNDHVIVLSPGGAPYRWASVDSDLLGGLGRYMNVPDSGEIEFPTIDLDPDVGNFQAVRAFVTLNQGWQFVVDETGLGAEELGQVEAEWPVILVSQRGYDVDEQRIMLGTGDADSPDAVLHFEALAFLDNVLRSQGSIFPDACSTIPNLGQENTAECAWLHGFGVFFPAAVQGESLYDTTYAAFSLESPPASFDVGDLVPARVGGALYDLFDAVDDGFDSYSTSFVSLWDALASVEINSFREFWDTWVDMAEEGEARACEALPSLYQNTINYNTVPTFNPLDTITMDEDAEEPATVNLALYVSDEECAFEALEISVEDPPEDTVEVEVDEDGVLHITPFPDWNGEVSLEVSVFDGVDFATQILNIVVVSVNDAPRFVAPPDRVVFLGETIIYELADRIFDPDHPQESLTLDVEVTQEDVPMVVTVDEDTFTIVFEPQDNSDGTNSVDLIVTDPEDAFAEHRVFLTWEPFPNEAPTIVPSIPLLWEAHKGQTIEMDLGDYATDDNDNPEELQWFVDPETLENATVSGTGTNVLYFTPDPADFLGNDEITLQVKDRDGATATVEGITLRWTPEPNIAPFINPPIPDFIVGINQSLRVDLRSYGHDQDDNNLGLRWYVRFVDPTAENPAVSGEGTQFLTFEPVPDFKGTIEVEFFVRDPNGAEASQVVRLTWREYYTYMPLMLRSFQQKPTN